MANISGVIITDCVGSNAQVRQELRFETLFGVKPSFVGVESYMPIEAAGNVLDQLDVLLNFPLVQKSQEHVVLVNVAPRGEDVQQTWDNGTPFCYFRLGKTLIVSTYEGHCLALARDLGIVSEVELLDIPTVTAAAVGWGDLTMTEADKINNTQFRSLEFLPLVAYWLWRGRSVPARRQPLDALPDVKGQVWCVDNFDNVKTTLLAADVGFEQGKRITLANGRPAICYQRLADVPQHVTALTSGSSGFGPQRFLEVVVGHRGRAAREHEFGVGSLVLSTPNQAEPSRV